MVTTAAMLPICVGREQELNQLREHLATVTKRPRLGIVFIRGEPGAGKSTLVSRLLGELASMREPPNICQVACADETAGALDPFARLVGDLASQPFLSKEVVLDIVKQIAPDWLNLITIGLPVATSIVKGWQILHPAKPRLTEGSVFGQYANILGEFARRRPLVLFIDDLHKADRTSLALLQFLANDLSGHPILFICAYRPAEGLRVGPSAAQFTTMRDELIAKHGAVELCLDHGIDAAEYLAQRYPGHRFPSDLVSAVQVKTEGHPFFIFELFAWWEKTGVIQQVQDAARSVHWEVHPDKDKEMPPTVAALIQARIGMLSDELKALLQRAAVEGEDFTAQTVTALMQLDDQQVAEDLDRLESAYELIKAGGETELGATIFDKYHFVHRLFRDAAYCTLSDNLKKILHRKVGEYLEQSNPEKAPVAALLMRHFNEAKVYDKTATYAALAATNAIDICAFRDALVAVAIGMDAAEHPGANEVTKQSLWELNADANYGLSDFADAAKFLKEAIAMRTQRGEVSLRLVELYTLLADTLDCMGEVASAQEAIVRGRAIAEQCEVSISLSHLNLAAEEALLLTRTGRNDEAVLVARNTLAASEQLPNSPELANRRAEIYNSLAIALSYMGDYEASNECFREAVALASRGGDVDRQASVLLNLADNYVEMDEYALAETTIDEALRIGRKWGDRWIEAYGAATRGSNQVHCGLFRNAIEELERSIRFYHSAGVENLPYVYAHLALAYMGLHDLQTAQRYGEKAVEEAEDDEVALGYGLDILAQVMTAAQTWEKAAALYEQALTVNRENGSVFYLAETEYHYAHMLAESGDNVRARELLTAARVGYVHLGRQSRIARVDEALANIQQA